MILCIQADRSYYARYERIGPVLDKQMPEEWSSVPTKSASSTNPQHALFISCQTLLIADKVLDTVTDGE